MNSYPPCSIYHTEDRMIFLQHKSDLIPPWCKLPKAPQKVWSWHSNSISDSKVLAWWVLVYLPNPPHYFLLLSKLWSCWVVSHLHSLSPLWEIVVFLFLKNSLSKSLLNDFLFIVSSLLTHHFLCCVCH